jgi:protein SCO1/2
MTLLKHAAALATVLMLVGDSAMLAQEFRVVGMVLEVDRPQQTFVVSHERIPGLMEAMTMPFRVRDPRELDSLIRGAMVEFTLVVGKESSHATKVRVRRYESVQLDPLNARRLSLLNRANRAVSPGRTLVVGQVVPDFTLVNQANGRVSLSDFRGKVVALNFIYTSCALPDFCFRTANNFGVLQRRFARELGRDLVLLTVTFDPARDRPDVLARYASQWNADPQTWHFLTGEVPDVQHVCRMFGVDFFPNEGLMDHSLRTAILDRQGTLTANIEGNRFTAGQLGDLVQNVLNTNTAAPKP